MNFKIGINHIYIDALDLEGLLLTTLKTIAFILSISP